MGLVDGVMDAARSVGRQFDQTPGGGFADEIGAVTDPTRAASDATERDLRQAARSPPASLGAVGIGARLSLATSDTIDRLSVGTNAPVDADALPDSVDLTGGGILPDGIGRGVANKADDAVRNFNLGLPDLGGLGALLKGIAGLVGLLIVVVALGQLFDINLGGG